MLAKDGAIGRLDIGRGKRAQLTLRQAVPGSDGALSAGTPIGRPISLQFNPKEYSISGGATYDQQGTQDGRIGEYQGSKPYTTSIEVFIDEPTRTRTSPTTPSISDQVDTLLRSVQRADGAQTLPPILEFSWGSTTFQAIATQVAVKFSMFNHDGNPIRATATLTLTILPEGWPKQNPTSGTPKIDRSHHVVLGDSLASIAHKTYGDPTLWRAIAEANGIDDPARLRNGEYVIVPVRSDAERMA